MSWFQSAANSPEQGGVSGEELVRQVRGVSHMKNVLSALINGNSGLTLAYMGLASHVMVQAPMTVDGANYCSYSGVDASTGEPFYGYDPTKRPWYRNASLATEPSEVVFNGVDADAGTGDAYIGLSKAIRTGPGASSSSLRGHLKAVVAVDLNVTAMYASLASVRKRSDGSDWSGYAFVVDARGYVALHPSTMAGKHKISQIEDAEFAPGDSLARHYFVQQIKPLLVNNSAPDGFVRYDKDGEEWVLAYSSVQPGDYTLCLAVSSKDLSKPADDLQAEVLSSVDLFIGLSTTMLVLVLAALVGITSLVSSRIAQPMQELSDSITQAQQAQYTEDMVPYISQSGSVPCPDSLYNKEQQGQQDAVWRQNEPLCAEMERITLTLEEMQVAMRFSNDRYHAKEKGNQFKAFNQAMEVVQKYDNERGKGACWANLAKKMQASDTNLTPMSHNLTPIIEL